MSHKAALGPFLEKDGGREENERGRGRVERDECEVKERLKSRKGIEKER